ncbi:MAG TPA: S16 family serine protease [Acidimicrobiia bacterium]|nr:S16 family serine protease [Acidimicrobiia bacterium]
MTDRARTRALTAAIGTIFLVGVVVLAWNVPLPLVAYSPGPVTDATDSVTVEGAPTYDTQGELVMLTVAGQDINAFEALVAAVDPSVDVLARQVVRRPDESDEDYHRRNLELMDQSAQTAIAVALSRIELPDDRSAVYVTGYAADTPAGEVLEIGDRIVALAGQRIEAAESLAAVMEGNTPGDRVPLSVERDGQVLSYEVELVPREDDPDSPMIGIYVRQLPFWIDIDTGIVGGPSAGMMYTLAIIDVLTPGSLTGGRVVAGTGTIDLEGSVGEVGGVRQKVVAAEAAGAEYMFVPAGNLAAAESAPRGDMELVAVESIDDALEFLRGLATG